MELYLEKRGCNFFAGDRIAQISDVGNYRVFTEFIDKAGTRVCGDFSGRVWSYKERVKYKRDRGIMQECPMYSDMGYTTYSGNSYGYTMDCKGRPYTIASILETVNEYSRNHYDSVKWVDFIWKSQKVGEVPDIPGIIREHFKGCEKCGDVYRCYTGVFRFMEYRIDRRIQAYDRWNGEHVHHEWEDVTIIMEAIPDTGFIWEKC